MCIICVDVEPNREERKILPGSDNSGFWGRNAKQQQTVVGRGGGWFGISRDRDDRIGVFFLFFGCFWGFGGGSYGGSLG